MLVQINETMWLMMQGLIANKNKRFNMTERIEDRKKPFLQVNTKIVDVIRKEILNKLLFN